MGRSITYYGRVCLHRTMKRSHNSRQWAGGTGGTQGELKFLLWVFKYIPSWGLYWLMAIEILFYMIANRKATIASYHYFRQCYNHSPLISGWKTYLTFYHFGQVILDRFAVYAGRTFHIEYDHYEVFDRMLHSTEGGIILQSHVGNYEMAGYMLNSDTKPINILLAPGEIEMVMCHRTEVFTKHHIRMIPEKDDMSHIFELYAVLKRGELVSIPADRCTGKTTQVQFFGRPTLLPVGPFKIIITTQSASIALFVMKTHRDTYRVICREAATPQEYASVLETIVRQYPTQWYNFFDFFKHD